MELRQDETGKAIVPVLSCVLKQLCDRNDKLAVSGKVITKFHAQRPPAISIYDYLHRIARYALCSGECFVLALVYIDRIIQQNPTFVVNSLNIHRLLITSVMLAAKFFDDQYFNNAYYAKVGGVPANEMNSLEVEFLFMTNFSLFVTTENYSQYYQELWNHANSNSICGCGSARVPLLILQFEAEEKERKRRVKLLKQRNVVEKDKDGSSKMKQDRASAPGGSGPGPRNGESDAMTDSPPRSGGQLPRGSRSGYESGERVGGSEGGNRSSRRLHSGHGAAHASVAMASGSPPVGVR